MFCIVGVTPTLCSASWWRLPVSVHILTPLNSRMSQYTGIHGAFQGIHGSREPGCDKHRVLNLWYIDKYIPLSYSSVRGGRHQCVMINVGLTPITEYSAYKIDSRQLNNTIIKNISVSQWNWWTTTRTMMTWMVKKEQGQDNFFNQQSILFTLPANTSPLIISSTYVGW